MLDFQAAIVQEDIQIVFQGLKATEAMAAQVTGAGDVNGADEASLDEASLHHILGHIDPLGVEAHPRAGVPRMKPGVFGQTAPSLGLRDSSGTT